MPFTFTDKLVICISSRALFDCSMEDAVYAKDGLLAYKKYHEERKDILLQPGVGFPLVKALLALNTIHNNDADTQQQLVEVVLVTRNDATTAERFIRSIEKHGLDGQFGITRTAFTDGTPVYHYLEPYGCDLFVSSDEQDVRQAIEAGKAAAVVKPQGNPSTKVTRVVEASAETQNADTVTTSATAIATVQVSEPVWKVEDQVRIAFDGDGVLFSDQAEQVYQAGKMPAFNKHELDNAKVPLPEGPLIRFAEKLQNVRQQLKPEHRDKIRTFLVTARGAAAATCRAVNTLKNWGLEMNESFFLQGAEKGPFLKIINPHIFFDDSQEHIDSAIKHHVSGAALVPYGVKNSPSPMKQTHTTATETKTETKTAAATGTETKAGTGAGATSASGVGATSASTSAATTTAARIPESSKTLFKGD